ncbi:MAG: rod shape-determining protein MreD [Candidatus Delongbacteria bacterium]|jgi:rod shape-determining protein MreD|nr:rod shape-determining protein MreD [Candidatus Delongbacteria bacterium]MDD4205342.1 rod shape-determining protein MreD [Candidatus Delongbacteria bacterium]MDY0016763.1 rod shape-determining protein MreD [Candidatus Delongbacteria bacterium]
MIKQHIKFAILLSLIIWVSIRYSSLYSVLGVKPDILLILLIRRSLHDPRPQISLAWGFSAGLIIDSIAGDVIGISSLTYSIVCFFVSFYKRASVYTPSYKRTLLYIYSISFSALLIYTVTASSIPFIKNLIFIIIPSAVYTMAAAVIFQTLKPTR